MIKSKNVRIYPSAYRGKIDIHPQGDHEMKLCNPEARLTTEGNIVRPFKVLADFTDTINAETYIHNTSGSFVISDEKVSPFEFVIDGYYFRLEWDLAADNPFPDDSKKYYGKIKVLEPELDSENVEFQPQKLVDVTTDQAYTDNTQLDNAEGNFLGLEILELTTPTSADFDEDFKYLLLVDNGVIPDASKLKFKQTSIEGGKSQPLNKYLETENIDVENVHVSDSIKDPDEKRLTIDFSDGCITSTGTLTIPNITSNDDLHITSPNKINIEADGTNNESGDDVCISLTAGGSQYSNYYTLPDTSDNTEPECPIDSENTLATREWVKESIADTWNAAADDTITFTLVDKYGDDPITKVVDNVSHIQMSPTSIANKYYLMFTPNDNQSSTSFYEGAKITTPTKNDLFYNPYSEELTVRQINGNITNSSKVYTASQDSNLIYLLGTESTGNQNLTPRRATSVYINSDGKTLSASKGNFSQTGSGTPTGTTNAVYVGTAGLYSSGQIKAEGKITGTSFNATSDRRLKENIEDYVCPNSILDLPIKQFDLKTDKSHHIGCIAQDLQEICPEIVSTDAGGFLSIEESKLVYLLLQEVKKLKVEVDKLKKK